MLGAGMLGASGDTFAGLGTLITAVALLITTVTGTLATLRGQRKGRHQSAMQHAEALEKVEEVKAEVVTGNEVKLGTLGADNETRRIEDKPHDERTATEQHHLDTAPPQERPQGPGR